MTVHDVIGDEDAAALVTRSANACPRTFHTTHRRKDGTIFPVEVHVTSVGMDAEPLLLAIVRDLTDRNAECPTTSPAIRRRSS